MKLLLLLVGLVTVTQAEETSSNSFQTKYGNKYKHPTKSYQLGVNQFADLPDEEFGANFKVLQADEAVLLGEGKNYDLTNNDIKKLPESIDWRTRSAVTDVTTQGSCGGGWAFSAVGSIEGQLAIQTGVLNSLSPQQLLDCDTLNLGCNGGTVQNAFNYVAKNGITLEQNYPYQEEQQTCSILKSKHPVVWTEKYVNIIHDNETDLKQAVGRVGPVSVVINARPIKLYKNGIFDSTCSDAISHAVLAVGYGTDNITGKEYWILKNTWGKDWGEQGYFKLRMGKNLCGIARKASYPILNLKSE